MNILSTSDYAKFGSVKGNRKVNARHVEKLVLSIETNNMLASNPIIVNGNMQVIDGQHRLKAAEKLGVEISYFVIPDADLGQVQLMNANMRPWSMPDYLESYIAQGNGDYAKLKEFTEKYTLPITVAAGLLMNTGNNKGVATLSKNGEFEVRDFEWAEKIARFIDGVREYSDTPCWKHRDFYYSLMALVKKGIAPDFFLKKLQASGDKIVRKGSQRDYLRQFEDVINKFAKGDLTRLY